MRFAVFAVLLLAGCDVGAEEGRIYTVSVTVGDSVGTANVKAMCHGSDVAMSGGCAALGVNLYAEAPDATAPAEPHGWDCVGIVTGDANTVTASAVCESAL